MGRRTNLALLASLSAAFATGWLAFAYATAPARWSLLVHATTGFVILALIPWKSVLVRRGLRRPRGGRPASMLLAMLVLASLLGGLLHSTGLLRWWGPFTAMELHVGAALLAVPLAVWHVIARPVRPRRIDLARRALLRQGTTLAVAAASYSASEAAVRLLRLPGADRRFTGSYEFGSFQPELMPVSSWMFDKVPSLDAAGWRLRVAGAGGTVREWTHDDLATFDDRLRAVLDCTGGFWSEQDWSGVLLSRLLPETGGARSVRVVSHTGYDRRFPVEELSRLLLATRVGGVPLSQDHGHPARLVSASRRGFWWVKWVVGVELDPLPHWWQLPFPLQ
ncbi:molybdopterin-dependent oxidoreductase [Candidatus Nephthysia bennettiae]|uniref:Molybdopterin-dependent oxidoreductase n=1 Tax=Candidatus Nephthysia bennettiae TaxID=3127016 RepID=A0A934N942_9BACT|nr:molybdopterin-dependent oxidoreductase [Candidatus Dormibacteraeota bacterium]MBJ7614262.1 molybdopterin-dependent oxidoreductase [Candidatus Dormibacteraeota bacterium]